MHGEVEWLGFCGNHLSQVGAVGENLKKERNKTMKNKEVPNVSDSKLTKLAKCLTGASVNGIGPLASSTQLAKEYKIDADYPDDDARVDSLVKWETAKNFGTGFLTGLGGFITLPIAIPTGIVAAWAVQARMVGAIAEIYGHSVSDERTKTAILLCLVGNDISAVLKSVGVKAGTRLTRNLISKIPGKVFIEINKKVGMRLLTKTGERGLLNLTKAIPLVGGMISGLFDAATCRLVGEAAKKVFKPSRRTKLSIQQKTIEVK
jgi:uncharacterized protein (DUF697 family)